MAPAPMDGGPRLADPGIGMLDAGFAELLAVMLGLFGVGLTLHDPLRTRASALRWIASFGMLVVLCLYGGTRALDGVPVDHARAHSSDPHLGHPSTTTGVHG
jgi:hypothetical protein